MRIDGSDILSPLGLSGGIVQVPAECKSNEQKMGVGVTVYHFVDSIEDVCLSTSITLAHFYYF
jgi:hypothetical protein